MSGRSEFSAGLAAKLVGTFADNGGTPIEANQFAENNDLVKGTINVLRGRSRIVPIKNEYPVLDKIATLIPVAIPCLSKPFSVEDYFFRGGKSNVKFSAHDTDSLFYQKFSSQIIAPRDGHILHVYETIRHASDYQILDHLFSNYETDLAAIFHLLEKQPEGEPGLLLTNEFSNIFYCRNGLLGDLFSVGVSWDTEESEPEEERGWLVYAASPIDPKVLEWREGRLVFSRRKIG